MKFRSICFRVIVIYYNFRGAMNCMVILYSSLRYIFFIIQQIGFGNTVFLLRLSSLVKIIKTINSDSKLTIKSPCSLAASIHESKLHIMYNSTLSESWVSGDGLRICSETSSSRPLVVLTIHTLSL